MAHLLLTALLVTLPGAVALAQDAVTDDQGFDGSSADDADQRARGLFLAGRTAYDRAQFEEALGYFEGAFERSGRPELLFNIGLSAQRADRRDRAIEAFRRYLAELPGASNRPDVEARIAELERDAAPEPGPAPSNPAQGPGALPWVIAIGSGVVAATGAVLLAVGLSDIAAVEDAPLDSPWSDYESRHDRAPAVTGMGLAMLGVGVAGAAAGVVLIALGGRDDEGAAVSVGPGAVVARGRF